MYYYSNSKLNVQVKLLNNEPVFISFFVRTVPYIIAVAVDTACKMPVDPYKQYIVSVLSAYLVHCFIFRINARVPNAVKQVGIAVNAQIFTVILPAVAFKHIKNIIIVCACRKAYCSCHTVRELFLIRIFVVFLIHFTSQHNHDMLQAFLRPEVQNPYRRENLLRALRTYQYFRVLHFPSSPYTSEERSQQTHLH